MSDSILDRIRQNRNRATVPPRNDGLISPGSTTEENLQVRRKQISDEVSDVTQSSEIPPDDAAALDKLKAELASLPETQRHSAIVLEKKLDQELTRYCKDNRITVEVFLEAAWSQASQDTELLQRILDDAKQRYKARKEAGKLRRLVTMLERKS